MLDEIWSKFISGSDIRGYALQSDRDEATYLSDDVVARVSCGFVDWLRKDLTEKDEIKIAVGHDTRISATRIKNVIIDALVKMGVTVIDCEYSSTPAMFMTTVNLSCNGSIEITASHHPYDKNGLKFFTRVGGLEKSDIVEILESAQENGFIFSEKFGSVEQINHMNTYAESLRNMICSGINSVDYQRPLRGMKIVVDAGNGIGGFYASKVLAPLGADIRGSQFLNYDGMFPNHIPNPENDDAMNSIQNAVIRTGADLGIIFDTDVDRAACVDGDGQKISGNKLIALASVIALENNEGGTIVTDSITSDSLHDFIEKNLASHHLCYKRGYRNIIDKMIELNESGVNVPLAIESSGHAAFRENYYLDDGAYLVTKIIIKMAHLNSQGKKLGDLISDLKDPKEILSVKLPINMNDFRAYGEEIIAALYGFAPSEPGWTVKHDTYEGIRVNADENNGNGWFILRMSVHDPAMPLNIESDEQGGVSKIALVLYKFLSDFKGLDITLLKNSIDKGV